MMIFLTILKIIGIFLLAVLLFVLTLLLLILFVPITYRVTGTICGKRPSGHARASWLFRLVNFHVGYASDGLLMYLRLFGIRKWLIRAGEDAEDDFPAENPGEDEDSAEEQTMQEASLPEENEKDEPVRDTPEKNASDSRKKKESSAQQEQTFPPKDTFLQKIRRKWESVVKTAGTIKKNLNKWSRMLENPSNQDAIKHIRRAVAHLLKCVLPSRLKLELSYSTGSPDTTAQIFGVLAMFPVGYTNRWKIHPDFTAEESYAEGEMDISGHFFLVQILAIGLGLLLDKKCRRLYRRLKRIKG